jgi:hypothetical protein
MIKMSLGLAASLGLGLTIAVAWPDVKRYLKIRQISAGISHPEMVPANGRTVYPQRPGTGAPDGTGDFDSASRGGPALA